MEFSHPPAPPTDFKQPLDELLSDEEDAHYAHVVMAAVSQPAVASSTFRFCRRVPGCRNVKRGHCRWLKDDLSPSPVYPPSRFRSDFGVPPQLYRTLYEEFSTKNLIWHRRLTTLGDNSTPPSKKFFVHFQGSLRDLLLTKWMICIACLPSRNVLHFGLP